MAKVILDDSILEVWGTIKCHSPFPSHGSFHGKEDPEHVAFRLAQKAKDAEKKVKEAEKKIKEAEKKAKEAEKKAKEAEKKKETGGRRSR